MLSWTLGSVRHSLIVWGWKNCKSLNIVVPGISRPQTAWWNGILEPFLIRDHECPGKRVWLGMGTRRSKAISAGGSTCPGSFEICQKGTDVWFSLTLREANLGGKREHWEQDISDSLQTTSTHVFSSFIQPRCSSLPQVFQTDTTALFHVDQRILLSALDEEDKVS